MQPIQLHSFDVFDTLITRPYTRPVDMFLVLAADLLGASVGEEVLARFAQARIQSESRARRRRGTRDDITLAMIYEEFSKAAEFAELANRAMAREVDLELESVVSIRSTISSVKELMASDRRVVFLSDMYLPTQVITDLLKRSGLEVASDMVYVSGDIGLSKHKGRLFDHVAKREAVVPRQCFHTGDNWKPDVLRPRQRGWKASLFTRSALTRFESPDNRQPYWLATRAGGLSRAARLNHDEENATIPSSIVTGVIAPFLTSFVCHVLLDAQRRDLKTLYFVSRDGQIFLRIAQALQAVGLTTDLTCKYLYGSRQAWFLPSVTEARREHLEWAVPKGLASSPRDILRRLEVDDTDVGALLGGANPDDVLDAGQLEQFIDRLLASEAFRQVLEHANAKRHTLIEYLRQEEVLDPHRRYALVDVGWSLQCQAAFRKCLMAEGFSGDILGYYLGVVEEHLPVERSGNVQSFIGYRGCDVPHRVVADWFFRLSSILVVEHLFTLADHPSVAGYEENRDSVLPVFKPGGRDTQLGKFIEGVHESIIAYARYAGRTFGSELASQAFVDWSVENVRRFICEPIAPEVASIAWLPSNREMTQVAKHTAQLATPLSMSDLARMARHDFSSRKENLLSPNYAWNEGAVAISPVHVRYSYLAFRLLGRHIKAMRKRLQGNLF